MTADGFLVTTCDGPMPQGGVWNLLPQTPNFAGARPDACGIAPITGEFALGEAKACQDIDTSHTRSQLRVFATVLRRNASPACRLYIAVPRSAALTLDRVLCQVGLQGAREVVPLCVPDCFLTNNTHDFL